MKVTLLQSYAPIANTQQNYSVDKTYNKLSFKSDSFEKTSAENKETVEIVKKLKARSERLFKEIEAAKKTGNNVLSEIWEQEEHNRKLTELISEYNTIIELLNKSTGKDFNIDSKIIIKFLDDLDKMRAAGKGLEKISGYDDIKAILREEYILKTMMKAKTSQGADVPSALLVFGPTNCGKTTFAHALAEETQSHVFPYIDGAEPNALTDLLEYAKESKKIYEKSGDEKTNSIIIINEVETIDPSSQTYKELVKFMKNCYEECKCTLYMTTNHIGTLHKEYKELLSLIPISIGIPPADKKNCKKIIIDKLEAVKKLPKEGVDNLVDEFFENPDRVYTNGNIVKVVTETLKKNQDNPNLSEQDFIDTLSKTRSSLTKEYVADFNRDWKKFQKLPKNK